MTVGVLTFALGKVYEDCAAAQALSWKRLGIPMTVVVVDPARVSQSLQESSAELVTCPPFSGLPFAYEVYAPTLSPYDITIKTDADVVVPPEYQFPSWIERFDLVSGTPCTVFGEPSRRTPYRDNWSSLDLPEVYSAFFMFARSKRVDDFFSHVAKVFHNFYVSKVRDIDNIPSTDLAYSIAWSLVFGQVRLRYGMPFIHFKPGMTGLLHHGQLTRGLPFSIADTGDINIGGILVRLPLHYQDRKFSTHLLRTTNVRVV